MRISWVNWILLLLASLIDQSLGGYEFLMQNCEPVILIISHVDDSLQKDKAGDKICILGFSRGAYTACWYGLTVLDILLLCFTKI